MIGRRRSSETREPKMHTLARSIERDAEIVTSPARPPRSSRGERRKIAQDKPGANLRGRSLGNRGLQFEKQGARRSRAVALYPIRGWTAAASPVTPALP